ncbi:MAG: L-lactate permease [Candidatus Sulfotelmatobacter sp.]
MRLKRAGSLYHTIALACTTFWHYRLTCESGQFNILQHSLTGITQDRRLQLLLIAFRFGRFFEGSAGSPLRWRCGLHSTLSSIRSYPETGFWEMCDTARHVAPQSGHSSFILALSFFARIRGCSTSVASRSEEGSFQQPDAGPLASLEFGPENRFPVCTGSSRAA